MTRLSVMVLVLVLMVTDGDAQTRGASCENAGAQGVCDSIDQCEPLRKLLEEVRSGAAPLASLAVLRSAICHYENGEPLVCCAGANATTATPGVDGEGLGPGLALLPKRCGISSLEDKIIDGEDAILLAWPWMALLRGTVNGRGVWYCGGSLISERYVLTAAHCFKPQFNVKLEYVRVGEHTLSQNPDCIGTFCTEPPQDITVEDIIQHPEYGSPCRECNDIAILRLSHPVALDPLQVAPVCLPIDPLKDIGFSENEFTDKYVWAAGWGSTARNSTVFRQPDVLQQVQIPIRDKGYCDSLKSGYPDPGMVLCAGGEGKDTCRGDSGGPIVLSNTDNRRFVVGVTSLGPVECGTVNTQGLYTSVHYYVPWILRSMRP